ncbi:hypothetical protein [Colwellia sp. M166]|nr:hypothetical protein [Colwellia sp. M166]
MLNSIINSISSTVNFFIEIKHISVSQWDVEHKEHMMCCEHLQQQNR